MAKSLFGFPYDEELFSYLYGQEPDPITTALLDSGAMVYDGEIAAQISNGSNLYTVPFHKTLGGEPVNYDGKTNITADETTAATQTGVVWGRAKAWKRRDFTVDFNNVDPMHAIVSQTKRFWDKQTQKDMLTVLKAIFGINSTVHSDDAFSKAFEAHTLDIASTSDGQMTEANKIGATTLGDATVKACGDNALGKFNLAVMHSTVAQNLAGTNLLEYRKYTDPMGIQRTLPIVDINGMTVIVFDGVPTEEDSTSHLMEYTTYLLGDGALRYAPAPVDVPFEAARDASTNGGMDLLYTRRRHTICPNGITYVPQSDEPASVTDAQLAESKRFKPVFDPKCLPFARVVSNG